MSCSGIAEKTDRKCEAIGIHFRETPLRFTAWIRIRCTYTVRHNLPVMLHCIDIIISNLIAHQESSPAAIIASAATSHGTSSRRQHVGSNRDRTPHEVEFAPTPVPVPVSGPGSVLFDPC